MSQDEVTRIQVEYARRAREIPADQYSVTRPEVLFFYVQRMRSVLGAFRKAGLLPLASRKILEVGCGKGQWLADFELWGAERANLAGIELTPERAEVARARLPQADIRAGDATHLPWPDASFDLVVQGTVFTSILDPVMKRAIAAEMARVLRPGGYVVWYDFFYDNPKNPNVKGVGRKEIAALFPGFEVDLHRTTLAPPLARRIVPLTWIGSFVLEKLSFLNTHYLGLLKKCASRS